MEEDPARPVLSHPHLQAVLADARARGFLGPGPVDDHIRHALRFAHALGPRLVGPAIDLGAGGGVPGLVLALAAHRTSVVLVDAHRRRAGFLREAVAALDLGGTVEVVWARAEDLGRDQRWRGQAATVVARGFGPPAVVAECAAPLLAVGGHLAVSEPPVQGDRWPPGPLRILGLLAQDSPDRGIWIGRQVTPAPARYPRRPGTPAKRPLF